MLERVGPDADGEPGRRRRVRSPAICRTTWAASTSTRATSSRYTYCPPASGNHYNASGQGPIPPRLYGPDDTTVPEGWVHNLEHGALVLLYRGDSPGATPEGQAALRAFFDSFPNSPVCGIQPGTIQGPVIARFDDMATPVHGDRLGSCAAAPDLRCRRDPRSSTRRGARRPTPSRCARPHRRARAAARRRAERQPLGGAQRQPLGRAQRRPSAAPSASPSPS